MVFSVKFEVKKKDTEVIKVELPKDLAERFRKYVAEKYGLRKGVLTKAIIDLIEKELGIGSETTSSVESIIGLGLLSNYTWSGEDLVEAIRKKKSLPN